MNTAPTPMRVTAPLLIAAAAAAIGAGIATTAPAQAKPGDTTTTTTTTTGGNATSRAEVNPGSRGGPLDRFFDRFTPPSPIFAENRFLDQFFDRFAPPNPCTGDRCSSGSGTT